MTRALACGLVACMLTGCGTAQNFARTEDGKRPLEVYGGTARSVDALKAGATNGDLVEASYAPFHVSDVALSAVADTLTLPVTVFATLYRLSNSEPPVSAEEKKYWREFWGVQESRELPVERMP